MSLYYWLMIIALGINVIKWWLPTTHFCQPSSIHRRGIPLAPLALELLGKGIYLGKSQGVSRNQWECHCLLCCYTATVKHVYWQAHMQGVQSNSSASPTFLWSVFTTMSHSKNKEHNWHSQLQAGSTVFPGLLRAYRPQEGPVGLSKAWQASLVSLSVQ